MIIDAHAHLDLEEITGEDYIRLIDASGVNKVVLLASLNSVIPPTPDWQISIMRFLLSTPLQPLGKRIYESLIKEDCLKGGGKTIQIVQNPDNDSVSQVVSRYPGGCRRSQGGAASSAMPGGTRLTFPPSYSLLLGDVRKRAYLCWSIWEAGAKRATLKCFWITAHV